MPRQCCPCCTCLDITEPLSCSSTNLPQPETSPKHQHSISENNGHQTRTTGSDSNVYHTAFWSIVVFTSVVSGGVFILDNTQEFLKSTVQTTLDSVVPLSQVLFPSVVVCNVNQVRKSLFNELGFHDNETLMRIMYEDFIRGTKDNSDNSTYQGSEFEEDQEHALKRKDFYQVSSYL